MEEVKQLIQDYLNQSIKELKDNYIKMGLKASGNWPNELSSELKGDINFNAKILGPDYTYQLLHGRKPGTYAPVDVIKKWIDDKGIVANDISKDSLAFLINRKIHDKGIIVPNQNNDGQLVNRVITDDSIDDLYQKITRLLLNKMKIEITNNLK